jgi:hypothetical protein
MPKLAQHLDVSTTRKYWYFKTKEMNGDVSFVLMPMLTINSQGRVSKPEKGETRQ